MSLLKKYATMLDGRDIEDTGYNPLTKEEITQAKRDGIVVVYGYSDDNMEFEGAVRDEVGCFNGGTAFVSDNGEISASYTENSMPITARWYEETDWKRCCCIPWSYETEIPHETFRLFEGEDPWCIGIVFRIDCLKNDALPPSDKEILFAKVRPEAIIPSKKEENAGYDIYACFDEKELFIAPHETKLVPTGIACALHPKWYFQVEERGSTGSKGIKKSAGVIDAGYRGEIFVAITNTNTRTLVISKDENAKERLGNCIIYPYTKAIVQLILHEVPVMDVKEISYEDLLKIPSERKTGALGSSGA